MAGKVKENEIKTVKLIKNRKIMSSRRIRG